MAVLHITAGDEMQKVMARPGEVWVPFSEAMLRGPRRADLFTEACITARAAFHGVTPEAYRAKFAPFLSALARPGEFSAVHLYFGNEDFCRANTLAALSALEQAGFSCPVTLTVMEEQTCTPIAAYALSPGGFMRLWAEAEDLFSPAVEQALYGTPIDSDTNA